MDKGEGRNRLEGWIHEYEPYLRPVARSFAFDEDEVDDIMQEAWVVALTRGKDRTAPMRPWLFKIVINVGRNFRAKRRRRARLREMFLPSKPSGVVPSGIGDELLASVLWREIGELPHLQQQALLHRIVDGLSTAETADVLDRAEGTVRASLHRALAKMKMKFAEEGER